MELKRINWSRLPLPCLVCGVDSWPIKVFLGAFIGSLVLASISMLCWAILTGRNKDDAAKSNMALEADKRE